MTVYVDDAFVMGDGWGRWQGGGHMQADTLDELQMMADRLGLRRSWLQSRAGQPWHDHYDLTRSTRAQAIRLGATAISWQQAAERNIAARRASDGRSGEAP